MIPLMIMLYIMLAELRIPRSYTDTRNQFRYTAQQKPKSLDSYVLYKCITELSKIQWFMEKWGNTYVFHTEKLISTISISS